VKSYVKVLDTSGMTSPTSGYFILTPEIGDASLMSYGDAQFFQRRAHDQDPKIDWEIRAAQDDLYVVAGLCAGQEPRLNNGTSLPQSCCTVATDSMGVRR
jgi:hypothetical protein